MVYEATCTAPVNIAVVKYWGKRNTSLILATNASLSVTLSQKDLRSLTTARVMDSDAAQTPDKLWLNGEAVEVTSRVAACLREIRKLRSSVETAKKELPSLAGKTLHIASYNNFPTAAGLASSASGLAALVFTLATLYELPAHGVTHFQLSLIARQGSGSACRSLFGGFVAWELGEKEDGSDSGAVQVADVAHWPEMQALICVVSDKKKGTGSTEGMQSTVATSPLLAHRIAHVVPARMARMEKAILDKNFNSFALETMQDSNQFHAVCLDTTPPIFYLNDTSRAIIALVEELNRCFLLNEQRRIGAYTFDAGPNAVIYSLGAEDTAYIHSLVLRYFPQPPHATVRPMEDAQLPKGWKEVVKVHETGAVARIIETSIGGGPEVLGPEEGLLTAQGTPKTLV